MGQPVGVRVPPFALGDMETRLEKTSETKRRFFVHLSPEEILEDYRRILRLYASNAKVPGFRKGKVPLEIAERLFGEDAARRLLEEKVIPIIREEISKKAKPIKNPIITDWNFSKEEGIKVEAEFEEEPEYDVEGYEGLEIEVEEPKTSPQEMVENTLRDLQERNTILEKKQGEAEEGDHVFVIIQIIDPETKKRLPQEKYIVRVSKDDEFSYMLIGKKKGDVFTYTKTYPDDYPRKKLAGKEVLHEVKVVDVRKPVPPELNDSFARKFRYKSMEEMRQKLMERAEKQLEQERENRIKAKIMEALREKNPIPVPEVLVDEEFKNLATATLMDLSSRGAKISEEEWVSMSPQIRKEAEQRVRDRFILLKIAEKQGFEVDKKEIKEKIKKMAERRGTSQKQLREMLKREGVTEEDLKRDILMDIALNYVRERVIIKKVEKSKEKGEK